MTAFRTSVLAAAFLFLACLAVADNKSASQSSSQHMSPNTRFAVIRTLEAERVYARRPFPMGIKGLTLQSNGKVTPDGPELWGLVSQHGAAARPGDRVLITGVDVKDDRIVFEINGGPRKKKKWWQHIQVEGMGGSAPLDQDTGSPVNPHGSMVALVFEGYVPEMTVEHLKELLAPVFDFSAHSVAQAYTDSLPPKVREAIKNHEVLVGMNREMALMAKGRPPKKIREREGTQDYEEWIYGDPPQDVEFIRFMGDEVVRVEIMKMTGEKIVRTEREVSLEGIVPHRTPAETAEGAQGQKPPAAPTLTRPGEDKPSSPGVPVSNRPDATVPGSPDPQPTQAPPPPPPLQAFASSVPAGS
ncbi:MAG TPA: hypothetical protein VGQ94_07890 [Terriglobales bacterium]|nr:hypothetical protein [Terriglobales bacterium]